MGTIAFGSVESFTGKGGMGWMLLASMGLLLAMITALMGARAIRDARRGDVLEDTGPDRQGVALATGSTGMAVLGGLLAVAMFFAPYAIGMKYFYFR